MAEFDKLSEYADEAALQKQTAFVLAQLKQLEDEGLKVASILKGFAIQLDTKGTSTKTMIDDTNKLVTSVSGYQKAMASATTDLGKLTAGQKQQLQLLNETYTAQQKATAANTELSLSVKQHEKNINALAQAQAKGNALTSETAIELAKTNLQNQIQVKANKEIAASTLGLIDNYGLLKNQYNEAAVAAKNLGAIALKTGNPADIEKAKQAAAAAKQLHDQLLTIETGVGQSQRNVGNYTGAINILKESLEQATVQLNQLTEAGKLNTTQGQQTIQEVELLNTLIGQQDKGFTSLSREVMNMGKALETLHEQGLQNTQAFSLLEQEFIKSKQKLVEFRNEQALLTSQAPKLNALVTAARGLGGIYATGAGAAALFAGENEKVQEKLNKLVAVMTLLQGLQEVHKLLLEKNAIATALFGNATTVATVGLEGEAVATEGAAVATGFFDKALKFLAANPIVLFLTVLTGALVYLISTHKSEEEQLKESAKASKEYSDAIDGETTAVETLNKLINQNLELQKKRAQALLEQAQAGGTNAATELAYKEAINKIDQKISAEQLESLPKMTEDINQQTAALKKMALQQKEQTAITKNLNELKSKGIKEIQTGSHRENLGDEKLQMWVDTPDYTSIENAIKNSTDLEKIYKDAIVSSSKAIDDLQKVKDHAETIDNERIKIENAKKKLAIDEALKLAMAEAQIEAQTVADKNSLILANEHSTFEQRIAAMKSNQAGLKALALAELNNVKNDPTKNKEGSNDLIIAEKQYNAKIAQIKRDGGAEIVKATEDNTKRILNAELEAKKIIITADEKMQEDLIGDNEQSLNTRLSALAVYSKEQQSIIDLEYEHTKAATVLNKQELLALEADHNAKTVALAAETQAKIGSIIKSELANEKKLRDDEIADLKAFYNKLGLVSLQNYASETIALNAQLQNKSISYKTYLKKKEDLDYRYQLGVAKNQLAELKSEAKKFKDHAQEIIDLQNKIASNQIALDFARTDADKVALGKKIALLKEELAAAKDDAAKQIEIKKQIADVSILLDDKVTAHTEKTREQKQADLVEGLGKIQAISDKTFSIIGGALNAIATAEKNRLQDQSDAIDKNAEAEIAAVNASADTAEVKAAKIIVINARVASEKEKIARKEKQIQIDQARFDKAQTIFNIILATALAIVKAKDPFSKAIAAISGAAELAVAIATPMPRFKTGLSKDYTGPGIVGDGGRSEAIIRRDGTLEITPDKDTLTYLEKGDRIHPNADEFLRGMQEAAMNDILRSTAGGTVSEKAYGDRMAKAMEKQTVLLGRIADKRENHLSVKDGALVSIWKHGANMTKYFNENTNW